jgi:glc operon protein GlcG
MTNKNMLEYGLPLTLSEAKTVMLAAEKKAREHDLAVIIAIVDSAAQLVLLQRMDHAQFGSIQVAIKKAENAVQFKRPTKIFEDALSQGGLGLRLLTITGICAVDGGIPLLRNGKIVGAVGAAGMLPHQDAQVAQAGVDALHNE